MASRPGLAGPAVTTPATRGPAEPDISVLPPAPAGAEPADEDPVQRLRRLMRERQDESIHVLSSWITDKSART